MPEEKTQSLLIPKLLLLAFPISLLLASYGNPIFVLLGAGMSLIGLLRLARYWGLKKGL